MAARFVCRSDHLFNPLCVHWLGPVVRLRTSRRKNVSPATGDYPCEPPREGAQRPEDFAHRRTAISWSLMSFTSAYKFHPPDGGRGFLTWCIIERSLRGFHPTVALFQLSTATQRDPICCLSTTRVSRPTFLRSLPTGTPETCLRLSPATLRINPSIIVRLLEGSPLESCSGALDISLPSPPPLRRKPFDFPPRPVASSS